MNIKIEYNDLLNWEHNQEYCEIIDQLLQKLGYSYNNITISINDLTIVLVEKKQ